MNEEVFEAGRNGMVDLLSRCRVVRDQQTTLPYAHRIPRDHPQLIGRGKSSLVFELPPIDFDGERYHLAGKGFKYCETSIYKGVPEDELHLVGCKVGFGDDWGLEENIYWLRQMNLKWLDEMDLGVDIPEARQYDKNFLGRQVEEVKHTNFTIMPDLREGGCYRVEEAEDSLFDRLSNGRDLRRVRDFTCRRILSESERLGLTILPDETHGDDEEVLPALEHMFLVQYRDWGEKSSLGDLNHLLISRKRQMGVKPDYLE